MDDPLAFFIIFSVLLLPLNALLTGMECVILHNSLGDDAFSCDYDGPMLRTILPQGIRDAVNYSVPFYHQMIRNCTPTKDSFWKTSQENFYAHLVSCSFKQMCWLFITMFFLFKQGVIVKLMKTLTIYFTFAKSVTYNFYAKIMYWLTTQVLT